MRKRRPAQPLFDATGRKQRFDLVSILILTWNEEMDLPGCLASVGWSDDVHVFDSGSTDRTQEIARAAGVGFSVRPFDNYAAQRNAALAQMPFKYEWIFILDGDERLSLALYAEMRTAIEAAPADLDAFRVRRNDHFLGGRLRHAQIMPWYTRLVRRGRVRYARAVNEVLEVDGRIGKLETPFDHYPCSKGLARWIEKHNIYSTMEARIVAEQSFCADASWKAAFFERDFHQRRRAQKAIFYRMPCRPLLRWAYLMLYRGGVLDGRAGWSYATLQAFYEYLIVLKTRELLAERAALLAGEKIAKPAPVAGTAVPAAKPPLPVQAAGCVAATSVFPVAGGDGTLTESADPVLVAR